MPKPAKRIVTFEEFMQTLRTEREVEAYHVCKAKLQELGWIDADLNVVGRRRKKAKP